MFSWHDAAGQRHAIDLTTYPLPPRPEEEITTLCGSTITLTRQDFPRLAEYRKHKKTCLDRDTAWRVRANLKTRPEVTPVPAAPV